MIGLIEGKVVHAELDHLIVLAGGVGYKVFVPQTTRETVGFEGEEVRLWTYLAVREDALDLFGFTTHEDRSFFELLLHVPGIGPKSALAVLNIAPTGVLAGAIAGGDSSYLIRVSGIGKKSAEKIVLELKDKVAHLATEEGGETRQDDQDALDALRALGYSTHESREALKSIGSSIIGVQARLKEALKLLSRS